jgi:integrase
MALAMSRPWKHPKTGVYWLRKRVPLDLHARVGKREEKRSLKTRDPAEAKRRHLQALSDLEVQWANLRAGPCTLTEREAHDLATVVHDHWLEIHRDNPSEQNVWPTSLGERVFRPRPPIGPGRSVTEIVRAGIDDGSFKIMDLEKRCFAEADELICARGLLIDETSRVRLAKAIAAAIQRASVTLDRYARGEDKSETIRITAGPDRANRTHLPISGSGKSLKFDELVAGWALEKRPAEKTVYEWKRVLRQLATFLGHDDAGRLGVEDLIGWKEKLIEAGLRPKTIRDAKLAPVRAILQWAVDNRRLSANPAERLMINVKVKSGESRRSFTEAEATIVLRAALKEVDPVRRWVPWLCAFSGARVSEVCQVRAQDIVELEGIWCVRFAPEAGSLKNVGSERAVPLHPVLIEQGFLEFVRKIGSGPLFAELAPDRFGSRGGNGTKVLGRWVRAMGLVDPRISPNHSWRHRLRTLGRRYGLATDILDAITGHRRKTVADAYGEFPMAALHREISKIPPVGLS